MTNNALILVQLRKRQARPADHIACADSVQRAFTGRIGIYVGTCEFTNYTTGATNIFWSPGLEAQVNAFIRPIDLIFRQLGAIQIHLEWRLQPRQFLPDLKILFTCSHLGQPHRVYAENKTISAIGFHCFLAHLLKYSAAVPPMLPALARKSGPPVRGTLLVRLESAGMEEPALVEQPGLEPGDAMSAPCCRSFPAVRVEKHTQSAL